MKTKTSTLQAYILTVLVALLVAPTSLLASDVREPRDTPDGSARPHRRTRLAPPPRVLDAVESIRQKAGGELIVSWSDRGVPLGLYGKLGAFGVPSEESARAFLAENNAAFKFRPDLADLSLADAQVSQGGTHVRFQQDYLGVKVHGAMMSVHFDTQGTVVVAGGDYFDSIALDSTTPELSAEAAHARLIERIGRPQEMAPTLDELVVFVDDDQAAHLAYHFIQPTSDERGAAETFEAFVDALDGSIIGEPRDINRHVSGRVYRRGNPMAALDNPNLENDSPIPAKAYRTVTLENLTSTTRLIGEFADCYTKTLPTFRAKPNSNGNYMFKRAIAVDKSARFGAVNTYFYATFAAKYLHNTLDFPTINDRSVKFAINGTTEDNSWYAADGSGTGDITLGSGGVDHAEDAEVILHEYGHSIQDNTVSNVWGGTSIPHLYAGTAAMGEGFGDYWACSIASAHLDQFGTKFGTALAEWAMADDEDVDNEGNPPSARSIVSPDRYPQDVTGDDHKDGEIWSSTLWQIRSDLGATTTDKLVIMSHFFVLSSKARFFDGAIAVLSAADALGFSQTHKAAIRNRFVQRGILLPI
jgi:Zn-dependent metalloprotease